MSTKVHFTRSIGAFATQHPVCGSRQQDPTCTAIIEKVTCRTCLKLLLVDTTRFLTKLKRAHSAEARA